MEAQEAVALGKDREHTVASLFREKVREGGDAVAVSHAHCAERVRHTVGLVIEFGMGEFDFAERGRPGIPQQLGILPEEFTQKQGTGG